MMRRLLSLLTLLSLLLCAAACVLWVRSYWVSEAVVAHRAAWTYGVVSRSGVVRFVREPPPIFTPATWEWVSTRPSAAPAMPAPGFLGFGYFADPVAGVRIVYMPWWSVLILAFAPSLLLRRSHGLRRAARRRAAGLCPTCGYDLCASPERCPECGTAPAITPS
jgi:hypothetical protein